MKALLVASIAAVALATSCAPQRLKKLPMYDECVGMPQAGEARCLRSSEISADQLPALIPYATVSISDAAFESSCEPAVAKLGRREKADVIYMGEPGTTYAGSIGGASYARGVAVGFSTPTYGHNLEAYCYRLSPVRLGIECDPDGMVVAIEEGSRTSGLVEGDRLLSLSGARIMYGTDFAKSPHYRKLIALKPGDEAQIVWIRPGTGRMEGKLLCLANPPVHLELPDALQEHNDRSEYRMQSQD